MFFFAVSLPVLVLGGGDRSAYVRTFATYPAGQDHFGLFGYSYTRGPHAMMAENIHYIDQTLTQNGAGQRLSLYFTSVRPLYAFAASMVAPIVGVIGALGLVNYLSWVAMVVAAWRFTMLRTASPPAAMLAGMMAAAGLGAMVHIHDYSPHLFPFALYFSGVALIYASRVWSEPRPFQAHLRIGVFLALASLAYSTGLVMTAAYALVSLRRNRWSHVAVASVLGISSQYIWTVWLNVVHALVTRAWTWTNVQGVEQTYMRISLEAWRALAATPAAFLARLWDGILQFASFEFAPLVVAAIVAWCVLPRRAEERWFDIAFVSLPVLVGLVYLNVSTTRGYLVYGVSIILYAVVAEGLAHGPRNARPALRSAATVTAALLVVGQVIWSMSYLWGYMVPAKMFFGFGFLEWIPKYLTQFQPPPAYSLTGAEPVPILFGGTATLPDAGLFVPSSAAPIHFSFRFALLYRAPLVLFLFAFALMIVPHARRRLMPIAACAAALWIVPSVMARVWPISAPPVFPTFYALHVPAGASWRYTVDVGDAFVEQLNHAAGVTAVQFMVPGLQPPFSTTIATASGQVLASDTNGKAVLEAIAPPGQIIDALTRSRRIEIEIAARPEGETSAAGVPVFGWQRNGLPGRTLTAGGIVLDTPTVPAFELRLLDAASRPILIGF